MSEFRVVEQYPKYEINRDGVLRRVKDGYLIKLQSKNGRSYKLNGKSVSTRKLVEQTFPVNDVKPDYGSNWRTIEEYPKFEISEKGIVRNGKTGNIFKTHHDRKVPYVILRDKARQIMRDIDELMRTYHPELFSIQELQAWRRIPNYRDYVIHRDGRIKNTKSGRWVNPRVAGRAISVALLSGGRFHGRGFRKIYNETFDTDLTLEDVATLLKVDIPKPKENEAKILQEMHPKLQRKKRIFSYRPDLEWRDIPTYPMYQMTKFGDIREKNGHTLTRLSRHGGDITALYRDGEKRVARIATLYKATWPEEVASKGVVNVF